MKIIGLLAGAALLLGAQSAHALTIGGPADGFENADLSVPAQGYLGLGSGSTFTTDQSTWTVGGSGGVNYIGNYWEDAQPGFGTTGHSIDLAGTSNGTLSTSLTGLVANQQYAVSFAVSANPDLSQVATIGVSANSASMISPASASWAINSVVASKTNMNWTVLTFLFTAKDSIATLMFSSLTGANNGFGPALDNVSIAATPIPGALLLFGSALGGMGFLGYRRRKAQAAA